MIPILPAYYRMRAYTSARWPIFWRSRYEIPLSLIIFLLAICVSAPQISRLKPVFASQTWFDSVVPGVVVMAHIACIALFLYWANKLSEAGPPIYAPRAINAPRFFTLLVIVCTFVSLVFLSAIIVNDREVLDSTKSLREAWHSKGFLSPDMSKNAWATTLLIAAAVTLILKIRNLFGLAMAAVSLVLTLILWFATSVFIATVVAVGGAYAPATGYTVSQDTVVMVIAALVAPVISIPAVHVVRSLRSKVHLRGARTCSAIAIWNAPVIVLAWLFALLAVGNVLKQSIVLPSLGLFDGVGPLITGPAAELIFLIIVMASLGLVFIGSVEYATVLAVRLMALPQSDCIWSYRPLSNRPQARVGTILEDRRGEPCDVFISYAREDEAIAATIARWLESNGLTPWYDRDLVGGQRYGESINRQIDAARSVVVIWSEHSIASDWVIYEARRAHQQSKHVPLLVPQLEPDQLPPPYPAVLHVTSLGDWAGLRSSIARLGVRSRKVA